MSAAVHPDRGAAPTLARLRAEPFWQNEAVPGNLTDFVFALADHFGISHGNAGTVGNAVHLEGRHRSIEWALNSAFCTDRGYGTTDDRDKRGNPGHIRAVDLTWINDPDDQDQVAKAKAEFHPLCHTLDNAVRAGLLPQVAEWFGTFDGRTVSGFFEGGPGSAGSSHLRHRTSASGPRTPTTTMPISSRSLPERADQEATR